MTSPNGNRSDLDAAADRIRQLNERILDSARNTGLSTLDVYEKTLKSIADMQQAVGQASSVQWFTAVAAAQANFTREMTEAYASAAREMLK
jgi:hypothetical protein